jgi:hypothetical protein
MITTTWQILWMPRAERRQRVAEDDEEPHPAAATAARTSRATVVACLS